MSNQIAEVFDHHFLWKESIDILVFFLHEISNQGKVAPETTTFHWVLPVVSVSATSLGRINSYLWHGNMQKQVVSKTTTLGWMWPDMCHWSNRIPRFDDHQYLWKVSMDTFVWPLSFVFSYSFYSSLIKLSGGPFSYDLLNFSIEFFFSNLSKTWWSISNIWYFQRFTQRDILSGIK